MLQYVFHQSQCKQCNECIQLVSYICMWIFSGAVPGIEEDLPSPILKDYNQGYHSDHSDHSSSADGRARSSRSSLKSSPSGSPFGSTQIITNGKEIFFHLLVIQHCFHFTHTSE
jgi:hypothetical protein